MQNKKIVLSSYPKAECRTISTPSGPYYMIYNMASLPPALLGYDIVMADNEEAELAVRASEERAWAMAAAKIGEKMLETLERSA